MFILRGAPQESVLGPVLFLLLTNDNWLQYSCHTVMNADDTVLTISNKSIERSERKTNNIFNETKDYCSKNNLVWNKNKTVQIVFITKKHTVNSTTHSRIETSNKNILASQLTQSSPGWTETVQNKSPLEHIIRIIKYSDNKYVV